MRGVDGVKTLHQFFAGQRAHVFYDAAEVDEIGVQSRADCRAAHVEQADFLFCGVKAANVARDCRCVGVELLTKPNGYGVLKLRASHLDHAVELFRLIHQRGFQRFQFVLRLCEQRDRCHFAAGGEYVVCGLPEVDVIIRIDDLIIAFLSAEQFNGTVGNDLVGVHVQRRAGAALDRINDKLVVPFPLDDFVARFYDSVGAVFVQLADLKVGNGGGFFDLRHADDHFRMNFQPGNAEVFFSPQRLHAIIGVNRHFAFADRIVL